MSIVKNVIDWLGLRSVAVGEHLRAQRFTAAWNALAPQRIADVRHQEKGIRILHPTKGWRFLSNKRLGLA